MGKKIFLLLMLVVLIFSKNVSAESIKLALIAPDGSTWANVMKQMCEELKTKTQGRWDCKIYAGGVAGDEQIVIKKMQIGQIDAAGFTGVGLGEIYPPIRVFELPFMFKNAGEVDYVVDKLKPEIKSGFLSKGYEFLGWAEGGFVNIFSNTPIKSLKDLNGVKMWMWQGDPLAKKMFETLGVVPVPLPVPDVLMALQTKMINGVYAPPLGAIAMQWFSKTKYMSDARLVNSIGALLITKRAFDRMTPQDQTVLQEVTDKYCKKLVELTRADNEKSITTLKGAGIEVVKVDDASLSELVEKSKSVWNALAGALYPKELLDKVAAYVDEYRKK